MIKSLSALGAVMTAALVALPASAETAQIHYSDLNLASEAGQRAFEKRVEQPARKVCGMNALHTGTRTATPSMRRCFADAKDSARQQLAAVIDGQRLGG